jgi:L-fucose mutarotase
MPAVGAGFAPALATKRSSSGMEGGMLKGIDPLIGPDLLQLLASMGHGDTIVLADANFPADSIARQTTTGRLVRLGGVTMGRAAAAILSLLPLDPMDGPPVARMAPTDAPDTWPPVQLEVRAAVDAAEGHPVEIRSIERFTFYAEAAKAYAVVQVADARSWGDFLLRKGVITDGD